MGRNRKQDPPNRTRRISIRVTDELYEVIVKDARAAGMSVSEYVRKMITGRTPKVHYELVYNDPNILNIFHNLGTCGNNLNQIARYLNADGTMTNPMWKDIKSCIAELYEMRDRLKEHVGSFRGSYLTGCTEKRSEVKNG